MPILDQAFGINTLALKLQAYRSEVLSSNLANADTPGYQARDVDFRTVLQQAQGGADSGLAVTNPRHLPARPAPGNGELLYRMPMQASVDGNTVDTEKEKTAFMENAVRYQATLTFIDGTMRSLRKALTGGQ